MGADQGAECETIAERECKIANVDAITALGGFGTPSERERARERAPHSSQFTSARRARAGAGIPAQ